MKIKRTATAYVCMNPYQCTACWKCIKNCPRKVIGKTGFLWHRHVIFKNPDACIGCCKCIKTCPNSVFFKTNATTPTRRIHASVHMERLLPIAFIGNAPAIHGEDGFVHTLLQMQLFCRRRSGNRSVRGGFAATRQSRCRYGQHQQQRYCVFHSHILFLPFSISPSS